MPDLDVVYDELSRRLSRHEAAFRASDNPTDANAARSRKEPRAQLTAAPTPAPICCSARQPRSTRMARCSRACGVGKRYVSYHLFSLYLEPGQLDGLSPELRKRMQGKTCFNFTRVDDRPLRRARRS